MSASRSSGRPCGSGRDRRAGAAQPPRPAPGRACRSRAAHGIPGRRSIRGCPAGPGRAGARRAAPRARGPPARRARRGAARGDVRDVGARAVPPLQPALGEQLRVRVGHHGPADAERPRRARGWTAAARPRRSAAVASWRRAAARRSARSAASAAPRSHDQRQVERRRKVVIQIFARSGYFRQSTFDLAYGRMSTDTTPLSSTARTTLRRHQERGRTDRADLYAVLDAGPDLPPGRGRRRRRRVVLPTAYGRDGDTLYLHGSSGDRSLARPTARGLRHGHPPRRARLRPVGVQPLGELPQRGGLRHGPARPTRTSG